MIRLDPRATALVAIDMHRGHLDPVVATLPLPAERCGPVIKRAAALFDALRARGIPIIHVVTEYRDASEIAANPFWKAAHDDPANARKGILRHNLAGVRAPRSSPSCRIPPISSSEARSATAPSTPPTSSSSSGASARRR